MGALAAFLSTLASMALSMGMMAASQEITNWKEKDAHDKGVDQASIVRKVNQVLEKAASLGQSKLSEVTSKLNSLEGGRSIMGSSSVQNVLNNLRSKYTDMARKYEKSVNEFNTAASSLQTEAGYLASTSDDYRRRHGSGEIKDLTDRAQKTVDKFEGGFKNYEETV